MLNFNNYPELIHNLFGFTGICYSPWEDTLMLIADPPHTTEGASKRGRINFRFKP